MYYYTFKATYKDGKTVFNYLYNEALNDNFSKKAMMTIVKDFIKKDLAKQELDINDFDFTRKLQNYKDFKSDFSSYKFINARNLPEIEIPDDMKQTDKHKEISKNNAKRYLGARLPKNPYGTWAKDPNYQY